MDDQLLKRAIIDSRAGINHASLLSQQLAGRWEPTPTAAPTDEDVTANVQREVAGWLRTREPQPLSPRSMRPEQLLAWRGRVAPAPESVSWPMRVHEWLTDFGEVACEVLAECWGRRGIWAILDASAPTVYAGAYDEGRLDASAPTPASGRPCSILLATKPNEPPRWASPTAPVPSRLIDCVAAVAMAHPPRTHEQLVHDTWAQCGAGL